MQKPLIICTILLSPIPVPSNGKMLEVHNKIICHTSARFDVIILITRILTDTSRSDNIKEKNLVEKLEFSTGWINKVLRKRNVS